MRPYGDHVQVSENVFENLPQWQQELWKDLREKFIMHYSGYVDYLAPHADPAKCAAIEPRYKELMYIDGEYCEVALSTRTPPGGATDDLAVHARRSHARWITLSSPSSSRRSSASIST